MSPKNYPRQVHFSPTWNPGTSTTTGAATATTHAATSTPAAPSVTTPVLSTPVVAAPQTSTTPATTVPPVVAQTSAPPKATVAEVPASVPKPNTTANVPTFGTKAGTMSAAISPTQTPGADSTSNGTTIAIIGGSVVVAVVILACAAVAWLRRRKAKQDRDADGLDFDRHAAIRQSTMIPDEPTTTRSATPSQQPMIDRHYNTPAVTYGYNVQPSYQGGPPQQAYQSQYAPGQVLFNAPPSGYATPSGYASGYATPGGAPATNLPSTQYAERAYTGPTGQPGSPMEQHHQYAEHEPVRRTSAGAYSNMSRGENSNEYQQQQHYADIERSLHGHDDDPHAPAPASPSPFGDQAQAPPSPRPGMTHQVPPPVHPATAAAHHDAAAHQAPGAAPAARGGAPAQRPQSTYDDDDAYGGM